MLSRTQDRQVGAAVPVAVRVVAAGFFAGGLVPAGFTAAGVAAEAMVALILAKCALEKFGGDSLGEFKRNFDGYIQQLKEF